MPTLNLIDLNKEVCDQDLNLPEMGSKICMNEVCGGRTSSGWKNGWRLKSGGFATLCYICGCMYETSVYCETFHSEESGWRECRVCRKRVHCGCIASRYLHEYMDYGGVGCLSCIKRLEVDCLEPLQDITNGTREAAERPLTRAIDRNDYSSQLDQLRQDQDSTVKTRKSSEGLLNPARQCSTSCFSESDNIRPKEGAEEARTSLNFSSPTPLTSSSAILPSRGGVAEGSELRKGDLKHEQTSCDTLPEHPEPSILSEERVARPPADGRGRNLLLPRYWPRITDQELQQLSGDLNSNVIPLFEKILSASDAGRIGRLVLPKACAETYFPRINQSEGIPIKIQDIKGKDWTFQFRFWPNNNSRMYVLEGVTPCMQTMQVQAGDTVIFSRRDPGGQLIIGCRKATNNVDDSQTTATQNETSSPGGAGDQLPTGGRTSDESRQQQQMLTSDKKKTKNNKGKRSLDELKVTCEEAQEFLRPAPTAEPTLVMIEDREFEEFDEPPIFGKKTASQPSRRSSSARVDTDKKDLESIATSYRGSKKRRTSYNKMPKEGETSGLDTLATAAVLGDTIKDVAESSVAATTRHPRHRPGCTCIVCSQPPSGTGKHDPSCKCNVCLTVRRRFKTLMMRKKKRQSEREKVPSLKSGLEREDVAGDTLLDLNRPDTQTIETGMVAEERRTLGWDLNCNPVREDDFSDEAAGGN